MRSKKEIFRAIDQENKKVFPFTRNIMCKSCKSLLWEVTVKGHVQVGDKKLWKKTVKSYKGVPKYEDSWIDNQPQFIDCPLCGKPYFEAVSPNPGVLVPIIKTLEDDFKK